MTCPCSKLGTAEQVACFVPRPYLRGHDHPSVRGRFSALVPATQPRLVGTRARCSATPGDCPASATYLRFALSLRDVEDLLAERGITVSYESIRRWIDHFGPVIAADLRKRRPKPQVRSRTALELELVALRHQVTVLRRQRPASLGSALIRRHPETFELEFTMITSPAPPVWTELEPENSTALQWPAGLRGLVLWVNANERWAEPGRRPTGRRSGRDGCSPSSSDPGSRAAALLRPCH